MNLDARVLRAMYALARRQKTVNEPEIAKRLGASPMAVHASMRRLQTAGLTDAGPAGTRRLTLAVLAIALALQSVRATRAGTPTLRAPLRAA
jgi:Mn-dependent DtxR family transcriptional regulator